MAGGSWLILRVCEACGVVTQARGKLPQNEWMDHCSLRNAQRNTHSRGPVVGRSETMS